MTDKPPPHSARVAAADPPCIVLDTNVVLDWLVFRDPSSATYDSAIRGRRLRWCVTPRMRQELALVIARPALEARTGDATLVLASFDGLSESQAAAAPCALTCADPDDQCFIDLALEQRARWLLTRDKALLRLASRARRHGTVICLPAAFSES